MLFLLYFSNILLSSAIQSTESKTVSEYAYDLNGKESYDSKDFWKVVFNTYYDLKGVRNETTDNIVESFFEHQFEAYPDQLYPAFRKIFEYISKSNDRIWNFYESILYLYHNVAASDRIYEKVLLTADLGKFLHESAGFDDSFPLDEEHLKAEMEHRSGAICGEKEPVSDVLEQPCGLESDIETLQVGSIRAIPGEHFPNYEEIPITSFTCAEKHIPGFYADLETGCQVFHVCYPHRRESFLCPVGTIFNQAILACDYWYSSNCSLAPLYFHSNEQIMDEGLEGTESFVDQLLEHYDTTDMISTSTRQYIEPPSKKPGKSKSHKNALPNIDWALMLKFLPVKSKITECPDFCGKATPTYPIESTTDAAQTNTEYIEKTTTRPIISTPIVITEPPRKKPKKSKYPPVTTASHKKEKYDVKTTKSEILSDILKAVEVLTKEAEGFLTEVQKESKRNIPAGIKTKFSKVKEHSKPIRTPRLPTEKPKHLPGVNPRFSVKPVGKLPRIILSSKPKSLKSKRRSSWRKS